MYGAALVAVLVLTGGAIAIVGDRVGMKVGKRRLSLFGLRPRHTSAVITVATGVAIAAASLVVMAIASANVRIALFHMDELQADLSRSREQLAAVEKKVRQKEMIAEALALQIDRLIRTR